MFKRLFDFSFSLVSLIAISPLLVVIFVIVKLTSKGPGLFIQERLGLQGKIFTVYKFRTMRVDGPKTNASAIPGDPRITPVGKFLRAHHLDELPQLWNVVRGDMSLVGPRPLRQWLFNEICKTVPTYREVLRVRPGLTGMMQIHGRDRIIKSGLKKYHYLERYYLKKQNFLLDVRILLSTMVVVITHRGV